METRQRHGTPAIPPWTSDWSERRQRGFGFLAAIPLALLLLGITIWILDFVGVGRPFTHDVFPLVFYTHVGAQFITLLIFGHLMIANPTLSSGMKGVWAFFFLFFAPVAIVMYWVTHVWRARQPWTSESQAPGPTRHVHVYELDYTKPERRGSYRREDGAIIHHLDRSGA